MDTAFLMVPKPLQRAVYETFTNNVWADGWDVCTVGTFRVAGAVLELVHVNANGKGWFWAVKEFPEGGAAAGQKIPPNKTIATWDIGEFGDAFEVFAEIVRKEIEENL